MHVNKSVEMTSADVKPCLHILKKNKHDFGTVNVDLEGHILRTLATFRKIYVLDFWNIETGNPKLSVNKFVKAQNNQFLFSFPVNNRFNFTHEYHNVILFIINNLTSISVPFHKTPPTCTYKSKVRKLKIANDTSSYTCMY